MSFNKKPKTINPDEVDPSVYYYDEVYDEMKDEEKPKTKESSQKSRDGGSKYIQGLKETAELRKTEKELRKFRKYARDREEARADGDLSDEDVYITDAYKQKLKEMKKLEEEKLRRLEMEKDNTMNFMKRPRVEKDCTENSRHILAKPGTSKETKHDEVKVSTHPDELPDSPTVDSEHKPTKRRPRTIEERREYLREVLTKRTTGVVLDEAVERYIQRKALAQKSSDN